VQDFNFTNDILTIMTEIHFLKYVCVRKRVLELYRTDRNCHMSTNDLGQLLIHTKRVHRATMYTSSLQCHSMCIYLRPVHLQLETRTGRDRSNNVRSLQFVTLEHVHLVYMLYFRSVSSMKPGQGRSGNVSNL
jgi:hypothetical protein